MDTCSICLEELKDNIVKLGCGHKFHKGCLEELAKKSELKCPECRKVFNKENIVVKNISKAQSNIYNRLERFVPLFVNSSLKNNGEEDFVKAMRNMRALSNYDLNIGKIRNVFRRTKTVGGGKRRKQRRTVRSRK